MFYFQVRSLCDVFPTAFYPQLQLLFLFLFVRVFVVLLILRCAKRAQKTQILAVSPKTGRKTNKSQKTSRNNLGLLCGVHD